MTRAGDYSVLMLPPQDIVTATSSAALRFLSYVFLRWVPGHPFPPLIIALAILYAVSFGISLLTTPEYEIVDDQISIITHPVTDDGPAIRRARNHARSTGELLEELDVKETITLEHRRAQVRRTLLTGLPSPSSRLSNILTFIINATCIGLVLDLTYRGTFFYPSHDLSFARLGFVAETSAKILIREPDMAKLPVHLSYRYSDTPLSKESKYRRLDTAWKHAGTISGLREETDFTASLEITHLRPDTRYQYALSNNHSGYFVTAPPLGEMSCRNNGKFTFLHTSCIKARFPYNPLSHPLSVPGFSHLANWLSRLKPHFLLFLGDFIYIDVPRRFGTDIRHYREEYRRVYASPDWPSVSRTDTYDVPWLHVYDDHEIANDWDRNTTGVFQAAVDPYVHYHVAANPPSYRRKHSAVTYFAFTQGPASFFMLDTRQFRDSSSNKDAYDPTKSMLGKEQLSDLLQWLRKPEPDYVRWKFVISSVPFTKNWRFNAQDTWSGYLAERQTILEAMWDLSLSPSPIGVVILSGDRHEFAATAFPPPAATIDDPNAGHWPVHATVHEFSASPLNMFYLPFRTYKQTDMLDVCLKYIPDGNSKFGAIEIETPTGSEQSVLRYRLFVDGKEVWSHLLLTPPKIDGIGGTAFRDGIWG